MNKLNVKSNLLDHSEAKVRLLGEYLKRYLNIISNDGFTEKIYIHDLFCGQGEYENGGYGSPLVALKNVKDTYFSVINKRNNKLPKIDCIFNDIEESKTTILKRTIEEKKLHNNTIGNLIITNNDYKEEVKILQDKFRKYKNEKAFVFIDPYGYKELKASDIKELIGSHKKSEILLWLPIQFMYRFSDKETPDVLKNLISDLQIIEDVKSSSNVWDFIYSLKKGFQNYLGRDFFVDNFTLKKEENTVFCLYFFTSHIKGFEKMLESKWEIDSEEGRGWEYSGNSPSLFYDHKTNRLEELLKVFLNSERKYNFDLYEFTLKEGFLTKHTNEILADWQNRGLLDVLLTNNDSNARRKSFYVKYYKATDVERKKVYYILK
ncbi:three-Cys-motif partner protein TcmP [Chryseobacterium indologenes]|uniref:Three-Cys-motif partner protein TcmP n=1 Tax=Chryseobacterium indologenes TaxID=253 RepID=A0AAD1DVV3_CHRID|nr:three-Cys-motif partner protein TcmP [Chryseobacterium indologenes]AZB17622.1 three-Cys-motif partner protein TcmP [Chryseobacterium indologenes]